MLVAHALGKSFLCAGREATGARAASRAREPIVAPSRSWIQIRNEIDRQGDRGRESLTGGDYGHSDDRQDKAPGTGARDFSAHSGRSARRISRRERRLCPRRAHRAKLPVGARGTRDSHLAALPERRNIVIVGGARGRRGGRCAPHAAHHASGRCPARAPSEPRLPSPLSRTGLPPRGLAAMRWPARAGLALLLTVCSRQLDAVRFPQGSKFRARLERIIYMVLQSECIVSG